MKCGANLMIYETIKNWLKGLFQKVFRRRNEDYIVGQQNNNMCNFCTLGSSKYLIKLLTLYYSLVDSGCDFHLWILAMDEFSYDTLNSLNLKHIGIIPLEILEQNTEILDAKAGKKENEYCWMLKAPLMEHVLLKENVSSVLYIDSDLYFFKNPTQIFENFEVYSIYLCPQNDMDYVELKYGKYQAGLVGFKNDDNGIMALNWWKSKCLEWCRHEYDPVGKRYGDQKYLDEIPILFDSVKCEDNYGVDAAPWNCVYNKERSIVIKDGKFFVNGDEIIVFHFSCITMYNLSEFDLWNMDKLEIPTEILNKIYLLYIRNLIKTAKLLLDIIPRSDSKIFSDQDPSMAKTYFAFDKFSSKAMEYGDFYHLCSIVSNEYLVRVIALYNSLIKYQENFNLWICAIDKEAYEALLELDLKNVTVISLEEVNISINIEANHNKREYCWVLKSVFAHYLLNKRKLARVLYCDTDMYFFGPIKHIIDEWSQSSFYVTTQRADMYTEHINGQYQAGLLGFKNDSYGREILEWWRNRCINWCFDSHDTKLESWGDQKYLDKIPIFFENIKVSNNLGINAAPWNLIQNNSNYNIAGNKDQVFINNCLLCCYHFGSMNIVDWQKFDLWYWQPLRIKPEIIELIYLPYMIDLHNTMKYMESKNFNLEGFIGNREENSAKNLYILKEIK